MLFGQQSADGDGACLWAAVAELLRAPVVSQVAELTVENGSVTGRRQTELGYERIRAPLPAVVAVSDAINEPRYPSLKGIMGAKSKPQDVIGAGDVGGVTAARTTCSLSPLLPRGASGGASRLPARPRRSSSFSWRGGSSEDARLLRAPRRRRDEALAGRALEGGRARRTGGGRDRGLRGRSVRRALRRVRGRDGVRRRRPAVGSASAAAPRGCTRVSVA